jgi:hypothetical protein
MWTFCFSRVFLHFVLCSGGGGAFVKQALLAAVVLVSAHKARVLVFGFAGDRIDLAKEPTPSVGRIGKHAGPGNKVQARPQSFMSAGDFVSGRFGPNWNILSFYSFLKIIL